MNLPSQTERGLLNTLNHYIKVAETEYNILLSSLIHLDHEHDPRCHLSSFNPPILSGILPFNEKTVVRVSVGSHRQQLLNNKTIILHKQTLVDITIPPKYILLFYHNGFIHSGGPGSGTCARMFTILGPTFEKATLQNKNYSGNIVECSKTCTICKVLNRKRKKTHSLHFKERFIGHEQMVSPNRFNYDLWEDGFCLVKVANDQDYHNLRIDLLNNFISKANFDSLNQEINNVKTLGKRCMLDKGKEISPDIFLQKNLHEAITKYIDKCYTSAILYLKKATSVLYEKKGHTMLINKGTVGYQNLHVDDENNCSCMSYETKRPKYL